MQHAICHCSILVQFANFLAPSCMHTQVKVDFDSFHICPAFKPEGLEDTEMLEVDCFNFLLRNFDDVKQMLPRHQHNLPSGHYSV